MSRPGPNDRCPCGSGKKYKKCCRRVDDARRYTQEERAAAHAKLEGFIEENLGPEDDAAFDEFCGEQVEGDSDLEEAQEAETEAVYDAWFAFDRPLDGGRRPVDLFLDGAADLTPGQRACLEGMRGSSMRLWEIEDARPGLSITLRDVIEGDRITVHEKTASRSMDLREWIAARIVPRGASGQPEIEAGVLHIPRLIRDSVRHQLEAKRTAFLGERTQGAINTFYKEMAPFFHEAWRVSILDPPIPQLRNTDGEEMIPTREVFEIVDVGAALQAVARVQGIEAAGESEWLWSGPNREGKPTVLGTVKVGNGRLVLEANSVERGRRGRELLETAAGPALRHLAASHEDLARLLKEEMRAVATGTKDRPVRKPDLPLEINEALVLDMMAKHYRGWLDDSIPALDGRTPRQAAKDTKLRPRLEGLLRDLEGQYQGALRRGEPAYDPSWMWTELGLREEAPEQPPPLAHERVAELSPGSGELCRLVAEEMRAAPGFDDRTSVASERDLATRIDVQRFVREHDGAVEPFLLLMVNHDLHRRKTFWVDGPLAFLLAQTDLDAVGRELRAPFASFALAFTDRRVLSLAERMLAADPKCPARGQILRVATVYVSELRAGDVRTLRLTAALDTHGADLPSLVRHTIALAEESKVERYLDTVSPPVDIEGIRDASPVRAFLQVVLNAILYATSAGVEPEVRRPRPPSGRLTRPGPSGTAPRFSSDEVFFLPGTIDISRLRSLEALDRLPEGRQLLRRFMVRGHFRRAAPDWKDKRMRWIEPHWKGPDLAAIIERTYRLKP